MYIDKYGFVSDGSTKIITNITPDFAGFTISTWVDFREGDTRAGSGHYDKSLGDDSRAYVMYRDDKKELYFGVGDTYTVHSCDLRGKHHFCVVANGATIDGYLDGVKVSTGTSYNYGTASQFTINHMYTSVSWQEYLYVGLNYEVKYFDKGLTEEQVKEEMYLNNNEPIGYWTLDNNTLDSSGNNNHGAVTGTEQYTIVDTEEIEEVNGELFERKETITFDSVANYTWLVGDWVYGGTMEVTVNATGNKTIRTSIYDPIEERDFLVDEQVTTGETITVELPENEARSMTIEVSTSEVQPVYFTEISYKFGLIAPLTLNNENVSAGASTYDMSVNYANNQTISDSMSVRVPKESAILFTTITESEIYFKNEKRTVLSRSLLDNFDINNQIFNLSLVRIL